MEYIALALKYRPKNFDEVVGQEYIVVALKNAILKKYLHHAYLFSGPRGVGKTSLARIFAKSLNCQSFNEPSIKPCNKCNSCIEINSGVSLDVIEIDGASNRGIDEIRTLRENVKLSPANSRYKIYIIDEVHMLTQEAFNALLKTLEEPPPHVKFIFATTHPQKVLPTILSRCQKFQFSLIPIEKIINKLKYILENENITIEENLLYAIARSAEGSIRDAESLLDQLIPTILAKEPIEDILSFLGIIDEEVLNIALKDLVEKNLVFSLNFIDKLEKEGKDLSVFLKAIIEHLRILLLAKVSKQSFKELVDVSPYTKEFIMKLSLKITPNEILRLIDLLIWAKELSTKLNSVRIPLELAIVKFSYKKEEKVNIGGKENIDISKTIKNINEIEKTPPENLDLEIEEMDIVKDNSIKEEKENLIDDNLIFYEVKNKWNEFISYIHKNRAAVATHLSFSSPYSSQGNLLNIAFSKKNSFHKEILEDSKNLKFLEEKFSNFFNKEIKIKFIILDTSEEENVSKKIDIKKNENFSKIDGGFINELLDTFGGSLGTEKEDE